MKKKLTAADLASPNPSEEAKKVMYVAMEKSCEEQIELARQAELLEQIKKARRYLNLAICFNIISLVLSIIALLLNINFIKL